MLAVVGMECVDGLVVGRVIDDPSDLFGGSIALGASLTAVAAALVSLLVIAFARVLGAQRDVIVRLLSVLVALPRYKRAAFLFGRGTRSVGPRRRASVYARRGAKRGPPILAA